VIDDVVLVDHDRHDYAVPLLVRYPIGATGRRPVVIWNHGGAPSVNGRLRSDEWGEALARAGYVVIHPSRTVPTDLAPLRAECTASGFDTPEECGFWIANMRYGPQNTAFLLRQLGAIEAADPALAGHLDPSRVVVAGHSAGSTTVLANAGAAQRWEGPTFHETTPEPIAFLATGPQGPTYAGFSSGFADASSFAAIDRPFLFVTGMGDLTGEPVPTRVTAWLTAPAGQKTLLWDTKAEAVHETMDVNKCDTALRADHCRWIASAGVAYLDAVVRHRGAAQKWLSSTSLGTASGGALELHTR
jgi:hypothetical protein